MAKEKKCDWCGREFKSGWLDTKYGNVFTGLYCSRKCENEAKKAKNNK